MKSNLLTRKILTYKDILKTKAGDSTEPLVVANCYDKSIIMKNWDDFPDDILVRKTIAKKLARINKKLGNQILKVQFGYRPIRVQKNLFETEYNRIKKENPNFTEDEIEEKTHVFIAVPDIAGHPTGGAVDITIVDKDGNDLDMGMKIANFNKEDIMATFAQGILPQQARNRMILHNAMIEEDFAPFYGEWWHFSYGDREWAAFYSKKNAIYGPTNSQQQILDI